MALMNLTITNGKYSQSDELPCDYYDLTATLRNLSIPMSLNQLLLGNRDVRVKLTADNEVGKHLISLFKETDNLSEVNDIAFRVDHAHPLIRDELSSKIIHDEYPTAEDIYDDIREMLYNAGTVSESYYFPLAGTIYTGDDYEACDVDNWFLLAYEDKIREELARYLERDADNMASYYDGAGNEKLLCADWDFEYLNGTLYGKVDVRLTEGMTESEKEELAEWISGQNSDGMGEGFEQQDIDTEAGSLNVLFWNNSNDYFVYDQVEMDEYIAEQENLQIGGM